MNNKLSKIFILDSSAIISGKPIDLDDDIMMTTRSVSSELESYEKDFFLFQYLIDKGLIIKSPSKNSITKIKNISKKTGDIDRLSETDIDILALALDNIINEKREVVILTDDYSIQNVSCFLNIKYKSINQPGITKKFKWIRRCSGCGKNFKENLKTCPICGSSINKKVTMKNDII